VIPPGYVGLVDFYLSQVRLDLSHKACRNILGHKHAMLTQHFLVKYSIPHVKVNKTFLFFKYQNPLCVFVLLGFFVRFLCNQ